MVTTSQRRTSLRHSVPPSPAQHSLSQPRTSTTRLRGRRKRTLGSASADVCNESACACACLCAQAIDRKERLRRLALETIDLAKDPYYMRNHLGQIECRLCLTLHPNEGNYLAHTQVSAVHCALRAISTASKPSLAFTQQGWPQGQHALTEPADGECKTRTKDNWSYTAVSSLCVCFHRASGISRTWPSAQRASRRRRPQHHSHRNAPQYGKQVSATHSRPCLIGCHARTV